MSEPNINESFEPKKSWHEMSYDEKLEDYEAQMAHLNERADTIKQQKKDLLAKKARLEKRANKEENSARNHRLATIGALMDSLVYEMHCLDYHATKSHKAQAVQVTNEVVKLVHAVLYDPEYTTLKSCFFPDARDKVVEAENLGRLHIQHNSIFQYSGGQAVKAGTPGASELATPGCYALVYAEGLSPAPGETPDYAGGLLKGALYIKLGRGLDNHQSIFYEAKEIPGYGLRLKKTAITCEISDSLN